MSKLTISAFLFLILIAGCGSDNSVGAQSTDVPNPSERFDLSDLDVDDTQSEIIRLLDEGYVMYFRIQMFASDGVLSPACIFFTGLSSECNTWPDTVIHETWETATPSGDVDRFYGQYGTQDGTLIATGVNGDWTDSGSGGVWTAGPLLGTELVRQIESMSTTIERVTSTFPEAIEGNYLGRPSIIVPRSLENEYQIANPIIWRETRWSERDDGTRFMRNEIRVVDFAMLLPGSFPAFALTSEN